MTDINVETPNGSIDAVLEIPSGEGPWIQYAPLRRALDASSPR